MLGADKIQYIDYIGFSFNGIHSSQLGVKRTTDSNRYTDNLLPTIQDKTVQAPGADGTYFFSSYYTQKPINLNIAFDGLTEKELRELKSWLSEKQPARLIYDETPYKYYLVKISGTPNLKYLPFDEICDKNDEGAYLVSSSRALPISDTLSASEDEVDSTLQVYSTPSYYQRRVYKGEGTLSFIAYYPYAKNVHTYLSEFSTDYTNIQEWATASGLLENNLVNNIEWGTPIIETNKVTFNIFNSGDIPVDFRLTIYNPNDNTITIPETSWVLNEETILHFDEINSQDPRVRFDTHLQLVEGLDNNGEITGNIYNGKRISGTFTQLQLGKNELVIYYNSELEANYELEYDFLYL